MEENKKILLLGYLGYVDNQIDGQTVKTRLIKEILENNYKKFEYIDTQNLKKNIFYLVKIVIEVFKANKIVIMPGKNGLKIIFPLVYFISKLKKNEIYYVVVGGWLVEFIKNKKILKRLLKKIEGIYLEIPELSLNMKKLGFFNCKILYNFRKIENEKINSIVKNKFKLVFFSRVTEEKGIFDLIKAIKEIRNIDIILDIYGPIKNEFKEELIKKISGDNRIKYKGILLENKIEILSEYSIMVFPTYYEGEGFAGVIIDSYMAKLPILASNWKYNKDFVIENKTGKLYKVRCIEDLKEKIIYFYNNKEEISKMKQNIEIELKKYDYEIVKSFLINEINSNNIERKT
ncbi:MAG: glycosyltransferase [Cetobacterium sp.]|uniref:glycosyltransferase n=1 Tax=Cetobacterium sp. TaxID=2071632 RepID=UPI003AA32C36